MLISQNPNFLFIHIQKTGGTSLEKVIRASCPEVRQLCGRHDHASMAYKIMGNDYNDYFKFAFVRNPWDRLVSWYSMIVQFSQGKPRHTLNGLWQYALNTASSFEEFILHCTEAVEDNDGRKSFAYDQLTYITDDDGGVIVDFVGRYENFARDARYVLNKLGTSADTVPQMNKSVHQDYRQYYTDRTRQLVAERYHRDIERFGYRF